MIKTQFNVERKHYGRAIEINWMVRSASVSDFGETLSIATKVEYTELTPENDGALCPVPLIISPDDAQGLMDELWRVGFRPTEGTGSAGSLAATERHLSDMQRIAFKLLEGGAP
jgi:hypothetical protein